MIEDAGESRVGRSGGGWWLVGGGRCGSGGGGGGDGGVGWGEGCNGDWWGGGSVNMLRSIRVYYPQLTHPIKNSLLRSPKIVLVVVE